MTAFLFYLGDHEWVARLSAEDALEEIENRLARRAENCLKEPQKKALTDDEKDLNFEWQLGDDARRERESILSIVTWNRELFVGGSWKITAS